MDEIREDELLAELERLRPRHHFNYADWTDEMNNALLKAREWGVSYENIGEVFAKRGWPRNRITLAKRYKQLTSGEK